MLPRRDLAHLDTVVVEDRKMKHHFLVLIDKFDATRSEVEVCNSFKLKDDLGVGNTTTPNGPMHFIALGLSTELSYPLVGTIGVHPDASPS